MFQQDGNKTLKEYRMLEANLHTELMNCSRKYLNDLGIVSIVGIMDIVKQEIMELEKAMKKPVDNQNDTVNEDFERL